MIWDCFYTPDALVRALVIWLCLLTASLNLSIFLGFIFPPRMCGSESHMCVGITLKWMSCSTLNTELKYHFLLQRGLLRIAPHNTFR